MLITHSLDAVQSEMKAIILVISVYKSWYMITEVFECYNKPINCNSLSGNVMEIKWQYK